MLSTFLKVDYLRCFNVVAPAAFKAAVNSLYNITVNYNVKGCAALYQPAIKYAYRLSFNLKGKRTSSLKISVGGTKPPVAAEIAE